MPGYQLALQLLGQAAAFPASAASLLQTNLAEAAAGSAAAVPFTAAVCRQVYLTLLRLLVHAALLLGSAAGLQRPGGLRRLLGAADDEAAQGIVEQVLLQQWQLLLVSCQATEDQLLAVVHTAIQALSDQREKEQQQHSSMFNVLWKKAWMLLWTTATAVHTCQLFSDASSSRHLMLLQPTTGQTQAIPSATLSHWQFCRSCSSRGCSCCRT